MTESRTAKAFRKPRIDKFIALFASGVRQTDAYVQVTPGAEKLDRSVQYCSANEFARHPTVAARLHEITRNLSVAAIDSHGQFHADLLQDMESARQRQNDTALAAFYRTRGMSGRFIAENIQIEHDHSSAIAVIERLQALAPSLAAHLRPLLGHDGFAPVIDVPAEGSACGSADDKAE